MIKIKQIILNVFNKAILLFSNPYYGFIQGHNHIDKEKIKDIKSLIGVSSGAISEEFEGEFFFIDYIKRLFIRISNLLFIYIYI